MGSRTFPQIFLMVRKMEMYYIYIVKDIRNFVCYNSLYYGINKYSMEVIGKR